MTSSVPAAQQAAERLAHDNVRLALDLSQLDAFNAIPLYADLFSNDPATRLRAIRGLDSINGLPALLAFLQGNPDLLLPTNADPAAGGEDNPGYDALSAIDVFFGDGDGTGGFFSDGNINALSNYDALSAIPVFYAIANATTPTEAIDALAGYDALSAVPVFVGTNGVFTGGGVNALGGYAALSAVDTFYGDNNGEGGVFTGGGIDALAPNADGNGGYAALSALPVFFGRATTDNGHTTSFGPGLFTGGGVDALKNYAALSAIPAYVDDPTTHMAPTALTPFAAPQQQQQVLKQQAPTPSGNSGNSQDTQVNTLSVVTAPADPAPPADPGPADPAPPAQTKSKNKQGDGNLGLFKPGTTALLPLGFGGGGSAADNGIRGWGDMLKKAGLNGGETSGAPAGGASAAGGTG